MKKTVKRLLKLFLCLLALILLFGCGGYFFEKNYVVLNGKPYERQVAELNFMGKKLPDLDTLAELKYLRKLDLRNTGLTLGEHEWLKRKLPDCEILWQVLFQGEYYLPDTQSLTITDLSEADLIMLDYLPEIKYIDASQCRDYVPLAELVKKYPRCRIDYTVEIQGRNWPADTEKIRLWNGDVEQLLERLPALPKLKTLELFGRLPGIEQLKMLEERFQNLEISWKVALDGELYPDSQDKLDLSRKEKIDIQELSSKLRYFRNLSTLDFRGTPVTEEEKQLLKDTFPDTEMLWDYVLDGVTVPGTQQVLDLSGHSLLRMEDLRAALPYIPGLEKLILCDCGFENEDLAALRTEYPDIKIIWNVMVGGRNTRTDETYFAPNKWGIKLDNENIYDLRYCTDMVCVDIGHMKKVTNCEWAAFMPELKYLILADGSIGDLSPLKDLKKLEFLELFLTPARDLSPLQGCTALKDLNLCYVYADPKPVEEMTWLKRLWWAGCWPAKNLLEKQMPDTEKNFTTKSSTGEGWREGPLYYDMRDFIGMGYMKG